jgi:hypothetical protein
MAVEFAVKALDNCGSTTIQCDPPSGSVFPLGTNVVTCIGFDAATNIGVGTFPVVVTTECRPNLLVVGVQPTHFVMAFDSQAATPYTVESTERIQPATWRTATAVVGTGNPVLITNPITTGSNRFYRVKVGLP